MAIENGIENAKRPDYQCKISRSVLLMKVNYSQGYFIPKYIYLLDQTILRLCITYVLSHTFIIPLIIYLILELNVFMFNYSDFYTTFFSFLKICFVLKTFSPILNIKDPYQIVLILSKCSYSISQIYF